MSGKRTDPSDILFDKKTGKSYKIQRFFGKGGFAKCYEIMETARNGIFAGKIISKKLLMKTHQKDKMVQEIKIHRNLKHKNIVKFYEFFDDVNFVYIILELCKNRSMLELYKRRRNVTEYECRYYMHQIVAGVKYLHENRIIHRDLKLGNLFLDDFLHVKIGDFGLATRVMHDGERRMTLCGTPNYIAPEIINKKGHSFEVDIWSIGCIMYTLLVGHTPFETKSLEETYSKIRKCEYYLPSFIRKSAANVITAMLQSKPEKRPTINELPIFDFFTSATIPSYLPISCLTMEPRQTPTMVPQEPNEAYVEESSPLMESLQDSSKVLEQILADEEFLIDLERLRTELENIFNIKPKILDHDLDVENTDPAAQPLFWISKWVDYTDKYGFGYQLCDECLGVKFNDMTTLILLPNQIDLHYIDYEGKESYMTLMDYCKSLEKKMKLLLYFKRYMTENLVKTVDKNDALARDSLSRMPHLYAWYRTQSGIIMCLTNGTVQINFFDHKKLIFCSRMLAVTYIDSEKNFRTYRFSTIAENGCSKILYEKLRYAYEIFSEMIGPTK